MLAVRWPGEAVRRAPDVLRAAAACLGDVRRAVCLPAVPAARRARPAAFGDPRAGDDELGRGERARPHAPHGDAPVAELARRAAAHALRRAGRLRRGRAARGGRRRGGDGAAAAHPGRRSRRGGGVGAVARGEPRGARPRHRRRRMPWRPMESVPLVGEIETMRFQVVVALCVAVVVALWLDQLADRPPGRSRTLALVATGVAMLTWLPANEQVADSRRGAGLLRRRCPRPDACGRRRDLPAQHRRLGRRGAADAVAGRERLRLPDHRRVLHRLGRDARPAAGGAGHRRTSRARVDVARRRPPPPADAAARRRATSCARWGCRRSSSSRKARTSGRCSTGPAASPGCPASRSTTCGCSGSRWAESARVSPYPGQGDAPPRPGSGSPTRTVSAPPPACSRHWPRAGSPSTSWRSGWRSSTRPATPPTCCRRSRTCPATTSCRCNSLRRYRQRRPPISR